MAAGRDLRGRLPREVAVMKLVEFTAVGGKKIHINPEQVRFVTTDREGRAEIVFGPSLSVVVAEPLEEVAQVIGRG